MAIIAIVSAVLLACGSSDTAVVASQDTAAPAVVAVDTTESTESSDSQETQISAPAPADATIESRATVLEFADTTTEAPLVTNEAAIVDLILVDDPATAQVLQSEADPDVDSTESTESALLTYYSDYGFALKLDVGADVRSAGWTELEPSLTQGIIAFFYGGVNANLVWGPPEDRTALTFLVDTYNILRAS